MAPATSTATASSRARRVRNALLFVLLIAASAGAAWAGDSAPVYIWRDANGVVRFSAPPVALPPR